MGKQFSRKHRQDSPSSSPSSLDNDQVRDSEEEDLSKYKVGIIYR